MAAAISLDLAYDTGPAELDWAPLDLDQIPAGARAAIEAADERLRNGSAQIVWEEDVPAALEEMRRAKSG